MVEDILLEVMVVDSKVVMVEDIPLGAEAKGADSEKEATLEEEERATLFKGEHAPEVAHADLFTKVAEEDSHQGVQKEVVVDEEEAYAMISKVVFAIEVNLADFATKVLRTVIVQIMV